MSCFTLMPQQDNQPSQFAQDWLVGYIDMKFSVLKAEQSMETWGGWSSHSSKILKLTCPKQTS